MIRGAVAALLAASSFWTIAGTCLANEARIAAVRVLGGEEDGAARALLPFTRQFSIDGAIVGSFPVSTAAAGVPPVAILEASRAFAAVIDLARELRDGDRFHVRWQQAFTIDNDPIGVGRVLSAELRTARKGTIAISRYRPFDRRFASTEGFFLANGREAAPAPVRLPLDKVTITSGFGLRPDPLDQPQRSAPVVVQPREPQAPAEPPPRKLEDKKEIARAYAGFGGASLGSVRDIGGRNFELDRIMAERRVRAREEEEARERAAAEQETAPPPVDPAPTPPRPTLLFMHEGLDLLANFGTPVHAAADGVIVGAGPNRGYGNWVRIDHAGRLSTVYAHLQRIAPGIEPGAIVIRGELVGFVGSTGRSTGAHLHFEVLEAGRPVDPQAAIRPRVLAAFDLARLRRQFAAEKAERERKPPQVVVAMPMPTTAQSAGD